jgi:hypothetical protein
MSQSLFAQILSGDDRDSYVSDVTSRASLYQELEDKQREAQARRESIEAEISYLRSQTPPSGADSTLWYRAQNEQITSLNDYLYKNDDNISKYESSLKSVKTNLDNDRKFIMNSDDPDLQQSLGTLIGIAGIAGIPVMSRPTMGTLKASVGRSLMGTRLNSTTKALTKASATQSTLQANASAMTAPVKGTWTTHVAANGDLVLQNGTQTKNLGVKAQVKSANGTMIDNQAGYAKAEHYTQIQNAKSGLSHSIETLKYERSVAKNAKAQKAIDSKIKELETKQTKLNEDIAKADSEKTTTGSAMKNLAMSAAKWAAFSVALTITTRAFSELKANNWDFKAIDWGNVVEPLKTAEFWGGTAGSFAGSMLLTSLIPGGAFVKTLAGIGGAALGWQLGSGNLMETDWMELGVSSVGATIGATLGMALGPIGSFLGGMAGHYLSTWLLGWVRDKLHPGYSANDRTAQESYAVDPSKTYADGVNLYRDADFGSEQTDEYGQYTSTDLTTLHQRMMELQTEMQAVMSKTQSGETMMELANLRQEYGQIQEQIYDARQRSAKDF